MITEKELLQAIKECERDPVTYSKCEKLANFYIVYDHLYGDRGEPKTATETIEIIRTSGDSEFLRIVDGVSVEQFLLVMDELLTKTLKIINPRLYDGVLQRLEK